MSENYFNIKNTITKSNELIESKYKLTLQQQKIICAVASKVRLSDTDFTEYSFHMKELAKLLELNQKGYYTEVRKVIRSLQTQVFTINKTVNNEDKDIDLSWFNSAEYNKTRNVVTLKFAIDLKPFLLDLKNNFTSYELGNVIKLNNSYSLRIYEILKSKLFRKIFQIKLDELYGMVVNKYDRYSDFKRNILEKCKEELAEKTDISFEFEEIKTGRKVTSIKFIITSNVAKNEIAASSEIVQKKSKKVSNIIKQVQDICHKHKITEHEANCILKDANSNMDLIEQCYEYLLTKDHIKNIVGYMRKLVMNFNKPQGNIKIGAFNNFEQRTYDFEELEKKLLGSED